jgi:hypothetical protein
MSLVCYCHETGYLPGKTARRGAWGAVKSLWARLIVWNPPLAESGTLPSVMRTERLYPCRGSSCSTSSVNDRHGDFVPRGTGLKAYARRLGTEQKAHRGERCAAVGGRTWPGGVRSSIRTPPPFEPMLRPPRRGVNPGGNS